MSEEPAGAAPGEEEGGDPACWLDRVCPECGQFQEEGVAHSCPTRPSDTSVS